MRSEYTIPLSQIETEFGLERVTVPENYESVLISTPEVWRPGLALAGFFECFEPTRIQIFGNAEHRYLDERDDGRRNAKIDDFFRHKPVAVVITSSLPPFP